MKHKTVQRETKTVRVHVEQGLALCQVANGEHIFHVTAAEVPQSLSKKGYAIPPAGRKITRVEVFIDCSTRGSIH